MPPGQITGMGTRRRTKCGVVLSAALGDSEEEDLILLLSAAALGFVASMLVSMQAPL